MRNAYPLVNKSVAGSLVFLLVSSLGRAAAPPPEAPAGQQAEVSPSQQNPAQQFAMQTGSSLPDAPVAQGSGQSGPPTPSPVSPETEQNRPSGPVGTAAAPGERSMGVAASRPAGAAIAPARQRRVRTIVIRLSVIAGAGVAIGTVAALSRASHSKPY